MTDANPTLPEDALGESKGPTQGNVLSVICTAELPTPNVTSHNSDSVENRDPVVLTCEPHTQDTTNLWLINHQSISNSTWLELSKDDRTLTLLRLTRIDSGPYERVTQNPVSASRSDPFHLNVLRE